MKTKVLDIKDRSHIVCIKDNSCVNPYTLYLFFPAKDRYGYCTEHRRKLAEYADFTSILCHITDIYKAGLMYKPYDIVLAWNREYYKPACF